MIEIPGVHPVDADEPVFLVDVVIQGRFADFDFGSITQGDPLQPGENWQVAYDERVLPNLPDGRERAAFFLHYLDLRSPLETPHGPVSLPSPTPTPQDLAWIEYEVP